MTYTFTSKRIAAAARLAPISRGSDFLWPNLTEARTWEENIMGSLIDQRDDQNCYRNAYAKVTFSRDGND